MDIADRTGDREFSALVWVKAALCPNPPARLPQNRERTILYHRARVLLVPVGGGDFANVLLGNESPVGGQLSHGGGVHESVAEPVRHLPIDAVRHPLFPD